MRILIIQAGDNYVELTRTYCNIHGTKYRINETERLHFDGRVGAPRKHLMRRVVTWINSKSGSHVKIMVLPGGALTKRLLLNIRGRTLYSELLRPMYNEPSLALDRFARNIHGSVNHSFGGEITP